MAEITNRISYQSAYRVDIIESERGWGQKIDEVKYFDNEDEAKKFVKEYNLKYNNEPTVPDWYMVAEYCGYCQIATIENKLSDIKIGDKERILDLN